MSLFADPQQTAEQPKEVQQPNPLSDAMGQRALTARQGNPNVQDGLVHGLPEGTFQKFFGRIGEDYFVVVQQGTEPRVFIGRDELQEVKINSSLQGGGSHFIFITERGTLDIKIPSPFSDLPEHNVRAASLDGTAGQLISSFQD